MAIYYVCYMGYKRQSVGCYRITHIFMSTIAVSFILSHLILDIILQKQNRLGNKRFTHSGFGTVWNSSSSLVLLGGWHNTLTGNTLDCDQSNYSTRVVFSHIPVECGHIGNSAIRSADPENPTVEPDMKWIGRSLAEIWPFEFFQMRGRSSVGGSSAGRRSVLNIYFFLHWSHILLFATLGT